jgi:hypothetical protein
MLAVLRAAGRTFPIDGDPGMPQDVALYCIFVGLAGAPMAFFISIRAGAWVIEQIVMRLNSIAGRH